MGVSMTRSASTTKDDAPAAEAEAEFATARPEAQDLYDHVAELEIMLQDMQFIVDYLADTLDTVREQLEEVDRQARIQRQQDRHMLGIIIRRLDNYDHDLEEFRLLLARPDQARAQSQHVVLGDADEADDHSTTDMPSFRPPGSPHR